ncbi:hypothetical protein T4B_11499 [Trichinella pseudospiralis]|uniref:Uncharacterized protein n=1 Tax=Trichinella pseudospiralis TaxID=6337 RepID=A0A0V1IAD3_TRIPS|nr:hypothetical protein T4A_11144 [Trichinella pseudospiralis]KRZ19803.1 hypothetical protein T4B_11499 [Trichinella pseudospiralis]
MKVSQLRKKVDVRRENLKLITTLEEESFSDNSSPDPTSRSFQLRESIELAVYKRSRPRHMVPKDLEGQ